MSQILVLARASILDGCGITNRLGERKVQFFNDLMDSYQKGFHKNEILMKIDAHSFNAIT